MKSSIIRKYDGLYNLIQAESEFVAVLGYPISQQLQNFPVQPHFNKTSERGSFFLKLLSYSQLIFATSCQTISTFNLYFFTCELRVRFLMGQPRNVQNAPGYL